MQRFADAWDAGLAVCDIVVCRGHFAVNLFIVGGGVEAVCLG